MRKEMFDALTAFYEVATELRDAAQRAVEMAKPRRFKLRVYVAHPVSAPDQAGIDANLANARAWLRWLVDHTPWAVSMPWMPYVETLPDVPGNPYRDRGLDDDLALVEVHDMVLLVGGRISTGMGLEQGHAIRCGIAVTDLTSFGYAPPEAGSEAEEIILKILEEITPPPVPTAIEVPA